MRILRYLLIIVMSFSCTNLDLKEYNLDYLEKLYNPDSIELGASIVYENGIKHKILTVLINECSSCFLPKNHSGIVTSYIASTIFGQGVNGFDKIVVEISNANSSVVGEYHVDELKLVKKYHEEFLSKDFSMKEPLKDLTCFIVENNSLDFNFREEWGSIRDKYPKANLLGFSKIRVQGDLDRLKYCLLYQLPSDIGFGTLAIVYNRDEKLESLYFNDNYIVDNNIIEKKLELECNLFEE